MIMWCVHLRHEGQTLYYTGDDQDGRAKWHGDQKLRKLVSFDKAEELADLHRASVYSVQEPVEEAHCFTCSQCGGHEYSLLSLMVPRCSKCGHWC